MAIQVAPKSAIAHSAAQRRESAAAVSAALRLWRRMGDDFDQSYAAIEPQLLAVMDTAQERITVAAAEYVPTVMVETGQRVAAARYDVSPRTFVGVAGDGLATDTMAYEAVIASKTAVKAGYSTDAALARGSQLLSLMVGTLLSDTNRGAIGMAAFAQPVTGWVRMLNPPSCGRCVILAGKHYKFNKGFDRHPGCDCYHIPASENLAGSLTSSPADYLNSLDEKELRKALGSQANAEAWNAGADPYQLINAYRKTGGVRTAQVYGRDVRATLEGVTKRGVAYSRMSQVRALSSQGTVRTGRYRALVAPRLMPETIFQIAGTNKTRAVQMLKDYGWII